MNGEYCYVDTDNLDNLLLDYKNISILKLDVEMHELSVLKGAKNALSKSKIKNIIYEDYPEYKSEIHKFLTNYEYNIYVLDFNLYGPKIIPLEKYNSTNLRFVSPNYIATIDNERLKNQFKTRGWKCLFS